MIPSISQCSDRYQVPTKNEPPSNPPIKKVRSAPSLRDMEICPLPPSSPPLQMSTSKSVPSNIQNPSTTCVDPTANEVRPVNNVDFGLLTQSNVCSFNAFKTNSMNTSNPIHYINGPNPMHNDSSSASSSVSGSSCSSLHSPLAPPPHPVVSHAPPSTSVPPSHAAKPSSPTSPAEIVKGLLRETEYPYNPKPSLSVMNVYNNYKDYDLQVLKAVRSGDVESLKRMKEEGVNVGCCNKFGESTLHLACRRGHLPIVTFLVLTCSVSPYICDDFGRTPLHDAFWTSLPQTEIVRFLLQREPRLVELEDKRGVTGMGYARKEHWSVWEEFFKNEGKGFFKVKMGEGIIG
ncbi:hypothetical protein TrVE_jg7242 [Triparma verrucosa]|uniref:Uncharacterized protein n=1 Tax=Triparma verrucosa TaxID=1606542 RepID=A0A9W7BYQ9_9STRA|nr:hypothetical protein TrVE_jg7242 [Triparma verrucosa]